MSTPKSTYPLSTQPTEDPPTHDVVVEKTILGVQGIELTKTSLFTGKRHTLFLETSLEAYTNWHQGRVRGLIQDVFPQLTASEREFMLSGTTSEEWDQEMGSEDDIEDEDIEEADLDDIDPDEDNDGRF